MAKDRQGRKSLGDNRPPGWRGRFGPDEVIQRVRPTETFRYLANPHKGTTTFQRFNGDPLFPGLIWNDREGPTEFGERPESLHNPRYPDTTISYCRWIWAVLEPEKGKYRWDIIDRALETARDRGQTLQVRVQPYVGDSVPQWYWDMGGTQETPPSRPGQRDIDHNNPLYIQHWSEMIRAFGERYDGHPDLESFDVAYGGSCGEEGGNATYETAAKLVDAYLEAFRKTQLILMVGTEGCRYAAPENPRLGWRYDCHGDMQGGGDGVTIPEGLGYNNTWDWMMEAFATSNVTEQWRTAPVVLETCWTVGHWYKEGWDIDFIIDHAYRYHPTVFMPKSSYIPEAWRERIDEFNRRIGYRFVIRQMVLPLDARAGEEIEVRMSLDNVGCAPLYRPYRFAYRFRQGRRSAVVHSSADVTGWMPGLSWLHERVAVPGTFEKGVVNVDVGIVEAETDELRVKFAIEEVSDDGWHPMTVINVL